MFGLMPLSYAGIEKVLIGEARKSIRWLNQLYLHKFNKCASLREDMLEIQMDQLKFNLIDFSWIQQTQNISLWVILKT